MFTKTVKFFDLDENEVEETFYFNFTKKEVMELIEFGAIQEFAEEGKTYMPLEEKMKVLSTPVEVSGLSNTENNRRAYNVFQDLILDAYGVKGADNRSFDKTKELRHYWSTHLAFEELIFEFIEFEERGAQFIEACLPQRLVAEAKKDMASKHDSIKGSESLSEMFEEANRRQQDPATRIEPGPEAAAAAIGENPEVAKAAQSVKALQESEGEAPPKLPHQLTDEDILNMPEEEFKKLDMNKLDKAQVIVAFRRRNQ